MRVPLEQRLWYRCAYAQLANTAVWLFYKGLSGYVRVCVLAWKCRHDTHEMLVLLSLCHTDLRYNRCFNVRS
jgi:hypothetical protein